jgi:Ribbon-helix-helix protein, copG family
MGQDRIRECRLFGCRATRLDIGSACGTMPYMNKDSIVRVRLDSQTLLQLEKLAEKQDCSLSWVIRDAIKKYLKK